MNNEKINNIKVLILAGGSGTRLWPLSRKYYPKQFLKFPQLDNNSLFQLAFKRALKITDKENIYVITNQDQKYFVMGEVEELGVSNYDESNIIIEKKKKGTFYAVCLGMQEVDEYALIMSSDHVIKEEDIFVKGVEKAVELSKENLVTFGIKPAKPHTGYGYINFDKETNRCLEFKEKPDIDTAKEYIEKGYVWNSGIFLFKKSKFDDELKITNKDAYELFKNNKLNDVIDKFPKDSVDFAILEKSINIATVPLDITWTDLGSFDSISEYFDKDENDNILSKKNIVKNSKNNYIYSSDNKLVVLEGVKDLIVTDTEDALVIMKKNSSENVKAVVKELRKNNDEVADFHKRVYRPWGSFTILEESSTFKVKRLTVNPGKILSLQKHSKRSEHWVVVKGEAYVVKGDEEITLNKDEGIYIPKETKHRIGNKSKNPVEIIETQSGSYLGEDDIERFEDKYDRV